MVVMAKHKLSNVHKLSARSLRSTCEAVEDAVVAARRADLEFRGRKLGIEAWINAVVRHFLTLPAEVQHEALRVHLQAIADDLDQLSPDDLPSSSQSIGDYGIGKSEDDGPPSPAAGPQPNRKNKRANSPKAPHKKP